MGPVPRRHGAEPDRVEAVVADWFDPQLLDRVLEDIKTLPGPWRQRNNSRERKLGFPWSHATPAMLELYDAHIDRLDELSDLVGAELVPDPKMTGAGGHVIPVGGRLVRHVDFNRLGDLYRRANVITYLNHDWRPEHGGELELGRPVHDRVAPVFGRTVAFATSDRSWHGHGEVTVPRYSFAFYAYSSERPDWYVAEHSTVFDEVP